MKNRTLESNLCVSFRIKIDIHSTFGESNFPTMPLLCTCYTILAILAGFYYIFREIGQIVFEILNINWLRYQKINELLNIYCRIEDKSL